MRQSTLCYGGKHGEGKKTNGDAVVMRWTMGETGQQCRGGTGARELMRNAVEQTNAAACWSNQDTLANVGPPDGRSTTFVSSNWSALNPSQHVSPTCCTAPMPPLFLLDPTVKAGHAEDLIAPLTQHPHFAETMVKGRSLVCGRTVLAASEDVACYQI